MAIINKIVSVLFSDLIRTQILEYKKRWVIRCIMVLIPSVALHFIWGEILLYCFVAIGFIEMVVVDAYSDKLFAPAFYMMNKKCMGIKTALNPIDFFTCKWLYGFDGYIVRCE